MGIPTKVPIDLVNPTPAASTDLSGYLPLNGGELTGNVYGRPCVDATSSSSALNNIMIVIKDPSVVKGSLPESNHWFTIGMATDNTGSTENGHKLGQIETALRTTGATETKLCSYKNELNTNQQANIIVGWDASGNKFTEAPTPLTSDNSTQIATTAFVNNRLPYETGTWTPTLSGSTTAGAFTYSYTPNDGGCYYVKLGHLVFLRAAFTYTITTAPSGEVRINGAPFVSNSYYSGVGGGNNRRWDSCQIPFNASYVRPRAFNSSTGMSPVVSWGSSDGLGTWINTVNSNDWIIFSLWYITNS